MKFLELRKNLQQNLAPIYLITGQDAFLRAKAVELIENTISIMPELNILQFSEDNTKITDAIAACKTLPMLADKKIVVMRDFTAKKTIDVQPIIDYAKNVCSSTCLVIVDNKGESGYQSLQKIPNIQLVDCSFLDVKTLTQLVFKDLTSKRCKINQNALTKLLEFCQMDYTRINGEVCKLCAYVGQGGTITDEMIDEMVHRDVEYDIFELTKAVGNKQGLIAVKILQGLLQKKEAPQMLLMTLLANFRRIFYSAITKKSNVEIAEQLGVKEWAIKKAKEVANVFSPAQLKRFIQIGVDLDYKIKSGKIDAENALYYYLTYIVSK